MLNNIDENIRQYLILRENVEISCYLNFSLVYDYDIEKYKIEYYGHKIYYISGKELDNLVKNIRTLKLKRCLKKMIK